MHASDDPWLTIDAALRWISERVGPGTKRRTLLEEIRRAASQQGGLQVTGRRQPLPGHEVHDGVLLRHRPMNLLPGGTSYVSGLGRAREDTGSPGRRTILHTAFIDGVIRRFPRDSAWWLTDNDDAAVYGWRDLRLLAADVRRVWPDRAEQADMRAGPEHAPQREERGRHDRGPKPTKRKIVADAMRRDIAEGKLTRAGLGALKEEVLVATYLELFPDGKLSRDTVRHARNAVLGSWNNK